MAAKQVPAILKKPVKQQWEKQLKGKGLGIAESIKKDEAAIEAVRKLPPRIAPMPALAERAAKAKQATKDIPKEKEERPLPKGFKMPKTLAACADLLYTTREERLAINKEAEAKEAVESALKEHLIDNLPKSNASGIAGRIARVTIQSKEVPKPVDWSAIYRNIVLEYQMHAKKKDGLEDSAFAILTRAITRSVVEEMWDNNRRVPGIESFPVKVVSINKL